MSLSVSVDVTEKKCISDREHLVGFHDKNFYIHLEDITILNSCLHKHTVNIF